MDDLHLHQKKERITLSFQNSCAGIDAILREFRFHRNQTLSQPALPGIKRFRSVECYECPMTMPFLLKNCMAIPFKHALRKCRFHRSQTLSTAHTNRYKVI